MCVFKLYTDLSAPAVWPQTPVNPLQRLVLFQQMYGHVKFFFSLPLSSPVINTKCHTQWTWMFQSMAFKKYRFPSFIINCICTPYFLSIRLSAYAALLYVQIQHLACLISKSKIKIKRPKCASNVSSTSCILVLHPDYCEAVLWQSPFLNVLYKYNWIRF